MRIEYGTTEHGETWAKLTLELRSGPRAFTAVYRQEDADAFADALRAAESEGVLALADALRAADSDELDLETEVGCACATGMEVGAQSDTEPNEVAGFAEGRAQWNYVIPKEMGDSAKGKKWLEAAGPLRKLASGGWVPVPLPYSEKNPLGLFPFMMREDGTGRIVTLWNTDGLAKQATQTERGYGPSAWYWRTKVAKELGKDPNDDVAMSKWWTGLSVQQRKNARATFWALQLQSSDDGFTYLVNRPKEAYEWWGGLSKERRIQIRNRWEYAHNPLMSALSMGRQFQAVTKEAAKLIPFIGKQYSETLTKAYGNDVKQIEENKAVQNAIAESQRAAAIAEETGVDKALKKQLEKEAPALSDALAVVEKGAKAAKDLKAAIDAAPSASASTQELVQQTGLKLAAELALGQGKRGAASKALSLASSAIANAPDLKADAKAGLSMELGAAARAVAAAQANALGMKTAAKKLAASAKKKVSKAPRGAAREVLESAVDVAKAVDRASGGRLDAERIAGAALAGRVRSSAGAVTLPQLESAATVARIFYTPTRPRDVLAAASAGALRSNQPGAVTSADLRAALDAGRVYQVSA